MAHGCMDIKSRLKLLIGVILAVGLIASIPVAYAQYPSKPQVTKDGTAILIQDYASVPISSLRLNGPYPAPIDYHGQLGKANSLRSEPADAPLSTTRFFVIGQNGILYILNTKTKEFTTYIDFGKIFPKFNTDPNLGMGLVSIEFDPAYTKNGRFYTVHTENPAVTDTSGPSNASLPTLDLSGFAPTASLDPPVGEAKYQSVIMEWKDTNIKDSTFEGTAREVLRVGTNFPRHPMGTMLFNPLARRGDSDYGNLYVCAGDGEAGERPGITHPIPQRLDAMQGKILRITPDITLRPKDMLSSNGRYRIPSTGPDPNPFVDVKIARPEIFAYGLRNPHEISWDKATNTLIAADIGNHSWEEVNIITKGTNYGWAEREGPEVTFVAGPNGGRTGSQVNPPVPIPSPDTLIVDGLDKPVTPVYPVAAFSHQDGLAIGTGFVYRGKLMPQMNGKYFFSDIATGRLFYTDLGEMIEAHKSINKQAAIHELQIIYKSPYGASQDEEKRRMFDIVKDEFAHKGGIAVKNCVLPDGSSNNGTLVMCGGRGHGVDPYGVEYGGGRADVRLAVGGDGEIYILSKADGMIRKMVSVVSPPPASKMAAAN